MLTRVGIEAWPVSVITHTDRCGRQATLRNLAHMWEANLQPNAELETVTPLNPTAIVFPLTPDYWFPVKKNLRFPDG